MKIKFLLLLLVLLLISVVVFLYVYISSITDFDTSQRPQKNQEQSSPNKNAAYDLSANTTADIASDLDSVPSSDSMDGDLNALDKDLQSL